MNDLNECYNAVKKTLETIEKIMVRQKELREVPPGIVAFRNTKSGIYDKYVNYDIWVANCFREGATVEKIKVNGVEWSVGEEVTFGTKETNYIIKSFEYDDSSSSWYARFTTSCRWNTIILQKVPTRKPVVTLQGKGMFEGDKYWIITGGNDWILHESIVSENSVSHKSFHSRELAEQYIRDNKPVYPAGLVEDLMYATHVLCCGSKNYTLTKDAQETMEKLKAFK